MNLSIANKGGSEDGAGRGWGPGREREKRMLGREAGQPGFFVQPFSPKINTNLSVFPTYQYNMQHAVVKTV